MRKCLMIVGGVGVAWIMHAAELNLYMMAPPGVVSRSISFENPTGAPGAGGQSASNLGGGRKGSPRIILNPGDAVTLCDIEGPGENQQRRAARGGERLCAGYRPHGEGGPV